MNDMDTLIYDNYTVNYTCTSLEPSTNYLFQLEAITEHGQVLDTKFVELRTPLESNHY